AGAPASTCPSAAPTCASAASTGIDSSWRPAPRSIRSTSIRKAFRTSRRADVAPFGVPAAGGGEPLLVGQLDRREGAARRVRSADPELLALAGRDARARAVCTAADARQVGRGARPRRNPARARLHRRRAVPEPRLSRLAQHAGSERRAAQLFFPDVHAALLMGDG